MSVTSPQDDYPSWLSRPELLVATVPHRRTHCLSNTTDLLCPFDKHLSANNPGVTPCGAQGAPAGYRGRLLMLMAAHLLLFLWSGVPDLVRKQTDKQTVQNGTNKTDETDKTDKQSEGVRRSSTSRSLHQSPTNGQSGERKRPEKPQQHANTSKTGHNCSSVSIKSTFILFLYSPWDLILLDALDTSHGRHLARYFLPLPPQASFNPLKTALSIISATPGLVTSHSACRTARCCCRYRIKGR